MDGTISRPESDRDTLLQTIGERIAAVPTPRLGVLLAELRRSSRLTLRDVALLPALRLELEDFEAGRLRPDAIVVETLLRCYNADLDELVVPRETLVVVEGTGEEVLTRYLDAVRGWRGSWKQPMFREADFQVLAGILGTSQKEIRRRLRRHAVEERIAALPTARLALLVRKLMASSHVTRRNVTLIPNVLQSQLVDVEAGRLRPDAAILEELLDYCDVNLDYLIPPRETLVVVEGTDKEVLTRYLAAVRRWRGSVKRPQLREADLRVLAGVLGTDPRDIQRRLRKLTGCSRRNARRLTAMVVAGMAITPVATSFLQDSVSGATSTVQKELPSSDLRLMSSTGAGGTAPVRAVPVQAAPDQTVPTQTVPTQTVPTQTVAAQTVPTQTVATHTVPGQTVPAQTVRMRDAPVQVAPVPVHTVAADCATALTYLAAHAKPGFAHYCRPGRLAIGITNAVAYTCVPGPEFACPDGNAEIIIADPSCAVSYENEASNSYWDFSTGAVIHPGSIQDGRTWDPYGECT